MRNYYIVCIGVGLALYVFAPVVANLGRIYIGRDDDSNLRRINLAIHNFESRKKGLPCNTTVQTPNGTTSKHSWRIHLAPFLDGGDSMKEYDFQEPWNGPNNSKLADKMPAVFRHSTSSPDSLTTPYKVVTSQDSPFETDEKVRIEVFSGKHSRKISIVADFANQVHWMEPDEFTVDEALLLFNQMTTRNAGAVRDSLFLQTYSGFTFGDLGGANNRWPARPDQKMPANAFSILDNQGIPQNISGSAIIERKWGVYLALIVFITLTLGSGWFFRERE